jgi:hypothetical protein
MHHGALGLRLESITMLTALHRQSPVSSILRSNSVVLHQIPNHLLCVTLFTIFRGYDHSFKSHYTPESSLSVLYCHINNFTCRSYQTAERMPTVDFHSGMRRIVPDNTAICRSNSLRYNNYLNSTPFMPQNAHSLIHKHEVIARPSLCGATVLARHHNKSVPGNTRSNIYTLVFTIVVQLSLTLIPRGIPPMSVLANSWAELAISNR